MFASQQLDKVLPDLGTDGKVFSSTRERTNCCVVSNCNNNDLIDALKSEDINANDDFVNLDFDRAMEVDPAYFCTSTKIINQNDDETEGYEGIANKMHACQAHVGDGITEGFDMNNDCKLEFWSGQAKAATTSMHSSKNCKVETTTSIKVTGGLFGVWACVAVTMQVCGCGGWQQGVVVGWLGGSIAQPNG